MTDCYLTRHRRGRRTGRSARRSVLLSVNEKQSARCRQLATTGQQALDDAASSGLHAGTKSPEVLTAGRAEFSDGFTLRLRCSKLSKGLPTTVQNPCTSGRRRERSKRRRRGSRRRCARQYYHARANLDPAIEIHDVLVCQPDAARGHEGADGRGLIGAVDAVHRLPEIESARAERVGLAASHEARQIRLAYDHLLRRIPIRPLRHPRHLLHAGPSKALATDANPVAQRLAVAEHEIKVGVRRIDDDRARRLLRVVINERATELRWQLLLRTGLRPHVGWECGHSARVAALRRSGLTRINW